MMDASPRILLVEDDAEIADMLRQFFTMQGYAFFHAGDGQRALELAPRMIPHAILMDVMLPDVDGYSLTARLRAGARTAHIPVLFASQRNERQQRLVGFSLGADDYIGKPYDVQELLLRVQNSIARAARDYLTDLRTGLPAAYNARHRLTTARVDPHRAIVEVEIKEALAYCNAYGAAAGADVHRTVGYLLLDALNTMGDVEDFLGYLDEDQFLIITGHAIAHPLAESVVECFRARVEQFYYLDRFTSSAPPIPADNGAESSSRLDLVFRITIGELPSA